MTARAHAAAVKAMLTPVVGLVAYAGVLPPPENRAARYVVLYVTLPLGANRRLSGDMSQQRVTLATLYVGSTPDECRWVAEKTQTALTRNRPEVAGRKCTPITLGTAGNPREDTDQLPAAWVATDVWSFTSTGPRI